MLKMEFTGERIVPDKTPDSIIITHKSLYNFAVEKTHLLHSLNIQPLVLDLACGYGYASPLFIAKNYVGGDVSFNAVKFAQSKYNERVFDTHFVCLNACELPFSDNSFDGIVSIETIEHLPNIEIFLSECKRVLKKNGIFVCSSPNKQFSTYNPYHKVELYDIVFITIIQLFFKNVTFYSQNYMSNKSRFYIKLGKILPSFVKRLLLKTHRPRIGSNNNSIFPYKPNCAVTIAVGVKE